MRLRSSRTGAGVVAAAVIIVACAAWAAQQLNAPAEPELARELIAESRVAPAATQGSAGASETTGSALVEVPDLTGSSLAEARILAGALGLTLEVRSDGTRTSTTSGDDRDVLAQRPGAGEVVDAGTSLVLTVPIASTESLPASSPVVCVDPGHQARSDAKVEPIGPDAAETKARATGGSQGVTTGVPEHEVALQISLALKEELEGRGVRVVMTRTSNDVNMSNAERAAAANTAAADLFVRVHCDASVDSDASGIQTHYPGKNRWTASTCAESGKAARLVQDAMIAATGAFPRGIEEREDLVGFNWAEMPAVLVECGYLSNSVEDRLLSSAHYQEKLAMGMADGIVEYLAEE